MPPLFGDQVYSVEPPALPFPEQYSLPLHSQRPTSRLAQSPSPQLSPEEKSESESSDATISSSVAESKSKEEGQAPENQPLVTKVSELSDTDSTSDQMPRKKAAQKDLSIATSSTSSDVANGEAEKMNNNVEMRRKNAGLDSPTQQTSRLMASESFTLDNEPPPTPKLNQDTSFFDLPRQDKRNFLLLVLLYFLQGVPIGLAGGSVPFLLKKYLSYGQIGVFSLATYPYSLKLFWSPIVDAVWSPKIGRRKSWILPVQLFSAFGLLYLGNHATQMMKDAGASDGSGVWTFTWWWFFLIFLCATQDIAVDGWALTLLTPANISYASTAQTVGITAGHFMSYTVFLAFNAPDFANKYFRKIPSEEGVLTLGGYMSFAGWAYLLVTIGLAVLKREEKTLDREGIMEVYKSMWGILKLRNIQSIILVHLIAKIGFQANDGATNLKLLDKGFSQENLALTVLIDFPFEIGLGYYAGRWSAAYPALHVWSYAFIGRLIAAAIAQGTVMMFPAEGTTTSYLLLVIFSHVYSTCTNTIMFVAISAFHARVADPVIGGTYMTLLAT